MAKDNKATVNGNPAAAASGTPAKDSANNAEGSYHGLRGSRVVIQGENPEEFKAMVKTLYAIFNPVGTYEHFLVKHLGDRMWELERIGTMKTDALDNAQYRDLLQLELDMLESYTASVERSIVRLRREISEVQALRGGSDALNGGLYQAIVKDAKKSHPLDTGNGHPENGHGNGKTHPPEVPDTMLFTTRVYYGPGIKRLETQGEAAIENLVRHAKFRMLSNAGRAGLRGLQKLIDEWADAELAADPDNFAPPDDDTS